MLILLNLNDVFHFYNQFSIQNSSKYSNCFKLRPQSIHQLIIFWRKHSSANASNFTFIYFYIPFPPICIAYQNIIVNLQIHISTQKVLKYFISLFQFPLSKLKCKLFIFIVLLVINSIQTFILVNYLIPFLQYYYLFKQQSHSPFKK